MESNPNKKEDAKQNKFEWADEGVSTLVRVVILGWSASILTLNYVTVPGMPQKISTPFTPFFIASVVQDDEKTPKDPKEDEKKQ